LATRTQLTDMSLAGKPACWRTPLRTSTPGDGADPTTRTKVVTEHRALIELDGAAVRERSPALDVLPR
jgi:hypothetical protein